MKASGRGGATVRGDSSCRLFRDGCRLATGRTSLRSSHSKLAAARAMAPMFPAFLLPTTTTHTSSSAAGGSRRRPRCRSHARFVMRPAEPFWSTASFHLSREALSPRRAPPGAGRRGAAASGDFRTMPPAPAGTAEVARTLSANIVPRACVVEPAMTHARCGESLRLDLRLRRATCATSCETDGETDLDLWPR